MLYKIPVQFNRSVFDTIKTVFWNTLLSVSHFRNNIPHTDLKKSLIRSKIFDNIANI